MQTPHQSRGRATAQLQSHQARGCKDMDLFAWQQDRDDQPGVRHLSCHTGPCSALGSHWYCSTHSTEILLKNNPGKKFPGSSMISLSLIHPHIHTLCPPEQYFFPFLSAQEGVFQLQPQTSAGSHIIAVVHNSPAPKFKQSLYPQRKQAELIHILWSCRAGRLHCHHHTPACKAVRELCTFWAHPCQKN